ncbi:tetratricopeptide repeat protein [bacterium]|nr:tetratricopeptide repeat protein [bacterium]
MEKIVIANDSTLENVRLNFRHILPKSEEIEEKRGSFKPLETLSGKVPENFFPAALTSMSTAEALKTLTGNDELELFFTLLLSNPSEYGLFEKLKSASSSISKENYLKLLIFLLIKTGFANDELIDEIKKHLTESDSVTDLILSFYDKAPHEITDTSSMESLCASFFEAVKAEKAGDYGKAFTLMLKVFEESDLHPFIFEILKFYIMQYSGISPEDIAAFTKKVTESSLAVSFTTVKFVEFCYYYKNNIEDKLEETVSVLAENTDSVFILNIIAPILYKYRKWHLVGKFYKLSSKKALGAEKTMYLELLADIYENKLELPDFAAEIYRNIAEEDPVNCTFSLSKAAAIYEENGSWEKLASLYSMVAERENNTANQALFFYKTGEIFKTRLNDHDKAVEYFEKSIAARYSSEAARALAELSFAAKNYDRYIELLEYELKSAFEDSEQIKILEKLSDCCINNTGDLVKAEGYLTQILDIAPKNLTAVKKLGKIYYRTKNWEKLTEINFKEIDISKDLAEIANLYYKNGVIFYENIKDLTRATECFRELLEIEPEHLPALFYLEKIFAKTKDAAGSNLVVSQIADMTRSEKSKISLSYLTKLAMILRETGKTKKANEIFSEILKLYPENITAKENLRMSEGKADFANIETKLVDYNDYDFGLFIEYIKQNNSSLMTDEILKHEDQSFWKELYFLYKEGSFEKSETPYGDKEKFVLSLFKKDFSIDILVKNSTRHTALMFLVGEYIKAGFFEGISIILDYYLKFAPKNKRKIWSLFFKGCGNPTLQDDLEELLTTAEDNRTYDIVKEILEHIYIKNKDFDTLLFLRNVTFQRIEDNREKCRFIDETISLAGESIAPYKLIDLYRNRINFTDYENLDDFLKIYEPALSEIGANSILVPIYEKKWDKEKETVSGEKLLNIYITKKDWKNAGKIAEELFKNDKTTTSLERYVSILKESGDNETALKTMKTELSATKDEAQKNRLKEMLFEILTETGNMEEAAEFFADSPEERAKTEEKIREYIAEENFDAAEKATNVFITENLKKQVLLSLSAKGRNDTEKENALLKSILFEAVAKKDPYPLQRLAELNRDKRQFTLFLDKTLDFIGENDEKPTDHFPNFFALEKEKVFEFAGFSEKERYLREFVQIISSMPDKTKIKAKPLHTNNHRILTQLIEYIKLLCNFDELEGLWDEESQTPVKAVLSQVPYIVFGPDSLKTDFEKLKFMTLKESFLLSCGLDNTSPETAEKILTTLQGAVKEKIKFARSIRPKLQNRALELVRFLENTDESEIKSYLEKLSEASLWHAFYLDPEIEETKDNPKTEEFINRYFL